MSTENKSINDIISASVTKELERSDEINFFDVFSSFEGTPQKHPTDKTKVILLTSPFNSEQTYYEFPISSVGRIEERESLTNSDGTTAVIVKLWIRKGTQATSYRHFPVT